MKWREATNADTGALLRLSREPMGGKVRLIWGLSELSCPSECSDLRASVIEVEREVTACALSWNWPNGIRYLSGLRFSQASNARPTPRLWKRAFTTMLDGVDYAWTSIGEENHRARKMLTRSSKCLPHYEPRQLISTWFVPLSTSKDPEPSNLTAEEHSQYTPADWRHVAIASGSGCAYRLGRLLQILGQPGIQPPNRRIRIAYFHPTLNQSVAEMRREIRTARGYDGLVVVLPDQSRIAQLWQEAAPKRSWRWLSTLYTVSWNPNLPEPSVPDWKGAWL